MIALLGKLRENWSLLHSLVALDAMCVIASG